MERMSLLTLIVIGEGAIGVTKTVSRMMGKSGLDVEGCFLIMCISLVLLRLVEQDRPDQKALLCILLVLIGSCMTLALEPLLAEITGGATRLDAEDAAAGVIGTGSYGQAYALFNMAWAGGNTVGPLGAGFIIEQAGWKTMTWPLGLLSGVTAVPVLLWCGGWFFSKRK